MKLQDAIKAVREENLTKTQLEDYHNQISLLLSELNLEAGDLEKEEALYLADRETSESVISRKVSFRATKSGQRLIIVKRYISAVRSLLNSLKSRLYNAY